MTLEDFLKRHAALSADKPAVVCAEGVFTYSQLYSLAEGYAEAMRSDGVKPHSAVVVRATPSAHFLARYFAVHMLDAVCVPMPADAADADIDAMNARLADIRFPADAADLLFTSGTTGNAKGVVVSKRAITANAENLIGSQGFSAQTQFIVNGPLNHIGSLSKVYPVILLGATLRIIDGMKDINAFFGAVDDAGCHVATFLVPAAIHMLLTLAHSRLVACDGKIDFIETGSAPISRPDMLALCQALPSACLFNTYASTETGIITTYNFNDGHTVAGCLGKTMLNAKLRINADGCVECGGGSLLLGYVDGSQLITDVLTRDGWFTTRDRGSVDSEQRLMLAGRADDIINVGGFNVDPLEVESVAMSFPDISECICVPFSHPVVGNALKLIVVMRQGASLDQRALARFIASKIERHKVPMRYELASQLLRTFNGKLNRKAYLQTV